MFLISLSYREEVKRLGRLSQGNFNTKKCQDLSQPVQGSRQCTRTTVCSTHSCYRRLVAPSKSVRLLKEDRNKDFPKLDSWVAKEIIFAVPGENKWSKIGVCFPVAVWELLEPYKRVRVCATNDDLTSKERTFRTHMIRLFLCGRWNRMAL